MCRLSENRCERVDFHSPLSYLTRRIALGGGVGCGLQFTVIGRLDENSRLDDACRIFQSMMRTSYNRLLQGGEQREVEVALLERYGVRNLLWRRNAIIQAKSIITSQRQLLPLYVEELEWKIQRVQRKLNRTANRLKRKGYEARVRKLECRKAEYENHIRNGTLPKGVFGGRKHIGSEAWRLKRRGQLLSVGDGWNKGNLNTRIHRDGDAFSLEVRNSSSGTFSVPLTVPNPYRRAFEALADGQLLPLHPLKTEKGRRPYTIRVIRNRKGCSCHVSFEAPEEPTHPWCGRRLVAVDVNPTHIDTTILTRDGNVIASRSFNDPALIYARKGKRLWLASNLIEKALKWVSLFNADTIVVEDLKLRGIEHGTGANRIIANFMHRKLLELIAAKTLRREWLLVRVPAAYSSRIAAAKYKPNFPRMSVHQLAALVLGRRALGLREDLNPEQLDEVAGRVRKRQMWVKALYLSGHGHPYLTPSLSADGRIDLQDEKGAESRTKWVTPRTRGAVKTDRVQRLSYLMPVRRGLRRVEAIRDDGWTRAYGGNAPPTLNALAST